MYRLEPLLDHDDLDVLAACAPEHHIEGTFAQYVVVSVPESCNMARAEEIKEQVMALVGRPVVVMSHNISLLKAVKLSASEAAECIRRGEEYAEAMQARASALTDEPKVAYDPNGGLSQADAGGDAGGDGGGDTSPEGLPPDVGGLPGSTNS